jgi:HPt (histidine-containing phosphotransfer) domain-containing protein
MVEDNFVNRGFGRSAIERLGCRVGCAHNGKEAVVAKPSETMPPSIHNDQDAGPEACILNQSAFDNLRILDRPGEESITAKLIKIFVGKTPDLIRRLHDSLEKGDLVTLHRLAHNLKSNGATFGADKFTALCKALELMSKEKPDRTDAQEKLVSSIEKEYRRVENALKKVVEEMGAQ